MSRSRHIRKAILIGIVENVNDQNENFSMHIKVQPKWTDETGAEKLGRSVEVEVVLDDVETIQRYKQKVKVGSIVQVEGELKTVSLSDDPNMRRKKIIVNISRYDGSIATLNIKKEEDMPYLNKVFLLGNLTNRNISDSSAGKKMGVFTMITKKSKKDMMTNTIIQDDHWFDIFVFNERLLDSFDIGREKVSNKMVLVEASLQSAISKDNPNEKRNTIAVAKRQDNKFIIIDTIVSTNNTEGEPEKKWNNSENSNNSWQRNNNTSSGTYNNNYKKNNNEATDTVGIDLDGDLPF